jgi:hypothetical protein
MNIITLGRHGLVARFGVLALLIGAPAVSRASLVFSNFGAGFSYNTSVGNEIGNDGVGDNLAEADTFTAGSTVTFSSLEIALSCFGACPDAFSVDLVADASGLPNTSSVLESFSVLGTSLQVLGGSAHLTLTSVAHPTLTAGTHYWIAVLSDLNDHIAWNLNTTGDSSAEATAFAGGGAGDTWFALGQTPGAYEVDGSGAGTPEPGTLSLMLGGGLLLGLIRKIRG